MVIDYFSVDKLNGAVAGLGKIRVVRNCDNGLMVIMGDLFENVEYDV